MDNDPLESGAGAGEPLHPDQDNAPAIGLNPADPSEHPHPIGYSGDDFRAAGRVIYASHPHGLAAVERLVGLLDSQNVDPEQLPPFDREVLTNILTALSRS